MVYYFTHICSLSLSLSLRLLSLISDISLYLFPSPLCLLHQSKIAIAALVWSPHHCQTNNLECYFIFFVLLSHKLSFSLNPTAITHRRQPSTSLFSLKWWLCRLIRLVFELGLVVFVARNCNDGDFGLCLLVVVWLCCGLVWNYFRLWFLVFGWILWWVWFGCYVVLWCSALGVPGGGGRLWGDGLWFFKSLFQLSLRGFFFSKDLWVLVNFDFFFFFCDSGWIFRLFCCKFSWIFVDLGCGHGGWPMVMGIGLWNNFLLDLWDTIMCGRVK